MDQILAFNDASSESICIASNGDVIFSNNMDNNAWYKINWEQGTKERMN